MVDTKNMIELRELTKRLSQDYEYRNVILELKDLVDSSSEIITHYKTNKDKIICYENMCQKITEILKNIKIDGRR
jgi:hypothetical protein